MIKSKLGNPTPDDWHWLTVRISKFDQWGHTNIWDLGPPSSILGSDRAAPEVGMLGGICSKNRMSVIQRGPKGRKVPTAQNRAEELFLLIQEMMHGNGPGTGLYADPNWMTAWMTNSNSSTLPLKSHVPWQGTLELQSSVIFDPEERGWVRGIQVLGVCGVFGHIWALAGIPQPNNCASPIVVKAIWRSPM